MVPAAVPPNREVGAHPGTPESAVVLAPPLRQPVRSASFRVAFRVAGVGGLLTPVTSSPAVLMASGASHAGDCPAAIKAASPAALSFRQRCSTHRLPGMARLTFQPRETWRFGSVDDFFWLLVTVYSSSLIKIVSFVFST